jgi:hypothetical protein
MFRKLIFFSIFVAALALASTPVQADTVTDNGVLFTATVTSTTVTVEIQCMVAACANWYIGDVTLKGFTFTGTPTTDSGSASGWTVENGGQNNDAIGSALSAGCNGTQAGMAICWDATLPLSTTLGNVLTPIFLIADLPNSDGSINDVLHVQATATSDVNGTNKVFAVSDDLLGQTIVPEASTLSMLGAGLLSLVGFGRRKITS